MHAMVYQLFTEKMEKENWLDEDTLLQGDGSYYDWCSEISEDERKAAIIELATCILPAGMFRLIDSETLEYLGGMNEWKKSWVANIHRKALGVNENNVMKLVGETYLLEKEIKNPLHTDSHFYLEGEGYQTFAEPSAELMRLVDEMKVGDRLYIGGIIDFHF